MNFHLFFKVFVAYKEANYVALQISEEMKDELEEDWNDWDPKFKAYVNPNTHGSITISDINSAYNLYYPLSETINCKPSSPNTKLTTRSTN